MKSDDEIKQILLDCVQYIMKEYEISFEDAKQLLMEMIEEGVKK